MSSRLPRETIYNIHSYIAVSVLTILLVATTGIGNGTIWLKPALAQTPYVITDESSCLGLVLSGGSATWDGNTNTCTIPADAELYFDKNLGLTIASGITLNNFGSILRGESDRVTNSGLINNFGEVAAAVLNNPTGTFENSGEIFIGGFSSFLNKGELVNVEDGFIMSSGAIYNDITGHVTNYGRIDATNNDGDETNHGLIDNFGNITNINDGTYDNMADGTINNHPGAFLNHFGDQFNNRGVINNLAGAVIKHTNEGSFVNFNTATINNNGAIQIGCFSVLTNPGIIRGNPATNVCVQDPDQPPGITAPASVSTTTTTTQTDICSNLNVVDATASGSDVNVPPNAIDNNLSTRWSAFGKGSWITLDLGASSSLANAKTICGLDIAWYQGNTRTNDFAISVSNDGTFFKAVFAGTSSGTTLAQERYDFPDSLANYVRVTVNGNSLNNWASIAEIDVTGYTSLGFPRYHDEVDIYPLVQNNAPSNAFPLGTTTVTWTAKDSQGSTASSTQQVTFSGPADTTRPNVAITSPTSGSTLTGPATGLAVNIAGTASDSGSGVQKVELRTTKNGVVIHPYSLVTPASPGNWATWSKSLTFTQDGTYNIVVRATDNAGNLQWHVISVQVTLTSSFPVVHMSDTTASSGLSVHAGRPAQVEFVTASSQLVGDKIDQITIKLRKVGSPTGTLEVGVINADLTVKKSFGTKNVGTLTGSFTDYTFSLTNNELYTIAAGDRIGIKYTGVESTTNYVAITRDTNSADPFDGSNTYYQYYTTTWNSVPSFDLYMILKQTHG